MKKLGFLLLTLCLRFSASGQVNLVPNPSFEIDTACPTSQGQIYNAIPWFQANTGTSSSDYYNACNTGNFSVPINWFGSCFAHSGVAYCGIIVFESGYNYREYFEVLLNDTLITNTKYCIKFYVNLSDSCAYAMNKMGAYFSSTPCTSVGCVRLPFSPQITNTSINPLINKLGWSEISGCFIANGGEKYLTIGNFFDDNNSDTVYVGNCGWNSGVQCDMSYYFIDDINVSKYSELSVNENSLTDESVSLSPNPATSEIKITTTNAVMKQAHIYTMMGQCILQSPINNSQSTIDISSLPSGMYIAEVISEKGVIRKRFVKQ